MNNNDKWILLYDSSCELCKGFIAYIKRFDTQGLIKPVVDNQFCSQNEFLDLDDVRRDLHLLGPDGQIITGAEAFRKVMVLAPVLKPVQWMLKKSFGKSASRAAYSAIRIVKKCSWCKKRRR